MDTEILLSKTLGKKREDVLINLNQKINKQGLYTKEIIIDDDVWLGKGVTVLPGVTIGKGSVIGANSLVNKNIPS